MFVPGHLPGVRRCTPKAFQNKVEPPSKFQSAPVSSKISLLRYKVYGFSPHCARTESPPEGYSHGNRLVHVQLVLLGKQVRRRSPFAIGVPRGYTISEFRALGLRETMKTQALRSSLLLCLAFWISISGPTSATFAAYGAAGLATLGTRFCVTNFRRLASRVFHALCITFHDACYENKSTISQLTALQPLDGTSFLGESANPYSNPYYVQSNLLLGTKCNVDEPEVSLTYLPCSHAMSY